MGDRLVVQGKERIVLVGTITRGATAPVAIQITRERSGKIRAEEGAGAAAKITGFNGKASWIGSGVVGEEEEQLLDILANDTAEHFFALHASSAPWRFYGSKFQIGAPTKEEYTGPYYDIYEMVDTVSVGGKPIQRIKIYWLNWQSQLLDRVQYYLPRGNNRVVADTFLENWRAFGDQQFPARIRRVEDGKDIFTVTLTAASAIGTQVDNVFEPIAK